MKRITKSICVLVLVVVTPFAAIMMLPDNYIRCGAESIALHIFNRKLSIGSLALKRTLNPVLVLSDITLDNVDSTSELSLVKARKLQVSISLPEIIKGHLHVIDLAIDDLDVHVQTDSKGQGSWMESGITLPIPTHRPSLVERLSNALRQGIRLPSFPRTHIDSVVARIFTSTM